MQKYKNLNDSPQNTPLDMHGICRPRMPGQAYLSCAYPNRTEKPDAKPALRAKDRHWENASAALPYNGGWISRLTAVFRGQ